MIFLNKLYWIYEIAYLVFQPKVPTLRLSFSQINILISQLFGSV
jgi:hypothetical protein